jgi:hypothetical protein
MGSGQHKQGGDEVQMTTWSKRVWLLVPVAVIGGSTAIKAHSAPVPVELRIVGDDGLTNRFRDTLEASFRSSSDFNLTAEKKSGNLVVTIPRNVDWEKVGTKSKVRFTAEFAKANDQTITVLKGECWDGALDKCATAVVKKARAVARKAGLR